MKSKFFVKSNLSVVQKICLAGLFIAISVILQKVLAINYLSFAPFLRISLGGPAIIIFSSVFLGPWYGLLIGAGSDIVGYLIFDPKSMSFFPQITAIYAVLGFVSYFVFMFIRLIKNQKTMMITEYSIFGLLLIGTIIFLCLNNQITLYDKTYNIELWQKITIPVVMFALFAILIICLIFTDKYVKQRNDSRIILNPYQVSFSCFILEIVVMVLFGSLMKGFAFGFQTYGVILITQILVAFINIPLNTFLISYIMVITKRYYNG